MSEQINTFPNLARAFDLLSKGCRSMSLHSWEDRFDSLRQAANRGDIDPEEIIEIIDYDYRRDDDGRAALSTMIKALVRDVKQEPVGE